MIIYNTTIAQNCENVKEINEKCNNMKMLHENHDATKQNIQKNNLKKCKTTKMNKQRRIWLT